jgi:hypothetical protein
VDLTKILNPTHGAYGVDLRSPFLVSKFTASIIKQYIDMTKC